MEISDLVGRNVSISIGLDDLRMFFTELAQKAVPEKTEKYLSPKQVCEMLDIDNSTLWRWGRNNYLPPFKVGGKNRYRMSDIQKLLTHE